MKTRINGNFWSCDCDSNNLHHVEQEYCCVCGVERDERRPSNTILHEGIVFIVNQFNRTLIQEDKPYLVLEWEKIESEELLDNLAELVITQEIEQIFDKI